MKVNVSINAKDTKSLLRVLDLLRSDLLVEVNQRESSKNRKLMPNCMFNDFYEEVSGYNNNYTLTLNKNEKTI